MKENKYDDAEFFASYAKMARSRDGLEAAGEWHELKKLLPKFQDAMVLDLGCGYGWHCRHAAEGGAKSVIGVDISAKMIARAKQLTADARIVYQVCALEDFDAGQDSFDVVLSSLTLHYVQDFGVVARKVCRLLRPGGAFVFSVEHPVYTAAGKQEWTCDEAGRRVSWPVDRYFEEGARNASFLGATVTKYHRTLTTYIGDLVANGFTVQKVVEPTPSPELLRQNPGWSDELRRPMMLLVAAEKKAWRPPG